MAANWPYGSFANHVNTTNTSSPPTNGDARIAFFITRTNGPPIPLIPADELPITVKLQNVPRVLTPDQTYGLQYCGNAPYTGATFKLDTASSNTPLHLQMQRSTSHPPFENSLHHHRPQSSGVASYLSPQPSRAETAKSWRRTSPINDPTDSAQSLIKAILSTESGAENAARIGYVNPSNTTPPPSGVIPDQDKKEYCTYWILHGDCGYMQQGCRYKHEMPSKAKLAEIGIHHVPRWWLESNAVTKYGGISSGVGRWDREKEKPVLVGRLKTTEEWLGAARMASVSSESTTQTVQSVGRDGAIAASERVGCESPVIPSTRPPSPTEQSRRGSDDSELDLIHFVPLVPTPSPASKAARNVAQTASQISSGMYTSPFKEPSTTDTPQSPPRLATMTTRVFVPAGESPEKHIAEANERAKRQSDAHGKAKMTSSTKGSRETPEEKAMKSTGLVASRWAKETGKEKDNGESDESGRKERQRIKSGCRTRRPASSSPAGGRAVEKAKK